MNRSVLLTFDVEEFDIPIQYKHSISPEEQMMVGKAGLDAVKKIIDQHHVPCTMFTTANFAVNFPEAVKALARDHEIASHTFYHARFEIAHLLQSRIKLEEISGNKVTGLRMPMMQKIDMHEVAKAGYTYDSSVNPTWIPGRYNNLRVPRTVYKEENITRVPASVSPVMRLPLFWLGFKNYPYSLFLRLCRSCLKKDGFVSLYFHPWEFVDINGYGLPGYVRKLCGERLMLRLDRLIRDLKREGEFVGMRGFFLEIKSYDYL